MYKINAFSVSTQQWPADHPYYWGLHSLIFTLIWRLCRTTVQKPWTLCLVSLPDRLGLCLPCSLLCPAVVSQCWEMARNGATCAKREVCAHSLRAPVQLYCSADQSWVLNFHHPDCLHFPTLHCAHILSPEYTNQRLNVSPPISCALLTLNRNDSSGAELPQRNEMVIILIWPSRSRL